jgi:hypothetical protein
VLTELYGQELADVLSVLLVCCGVEMIPYDGFSISMVALLRKVLENRNRQRYTIRWNSI